MTDRLTATRSWNLGFRRLVMTICAISCLGMACGNPEQMAKRDSVVTMDLTSNLPDTAFYGRLRRVDADPDEGWERLGAGREVPAKLHTGGRYEIKATHAGYRDKFLTITEPIPRYGFTFLQADIIGVVGGGGKPPVVPPPPPPPPPLPDCEFASLPPASSGYEASMAVLDFGVGDGMKSDVGKGLADYCRDAVQESNRFTILDRERIAAVLGEQDFVAAMKCDSTTCIVEYGRLLGATKMMHGRISQLDEHHYVLAVYITDVNTGKQTGQAGSLSSRGESAVAMRKLVCEVIRQTIAE